MGRLTRAPGFDRHCYSGCLAAGCRLQYLEVVCLAALQTTCEGGEGWIQQRVDFREAFQGKAAVCWQDPRHLTKVVCVPGAARQAWWWSVRLEEALAAASEVLKVAPAASAARLGDPPGLHCHLKKMIVESAPLLDPNSHFQNPSTCPLSASATLSAVRCLHCWVSWSGHCGEGGSGVLSLARSQSATRLAIGAG